MTASRAAIVVGVADGDGGGVPTAEDAVVVLHSHLRDTGCPSRSLDLSRCLYSRISEWPRIRRCREPPGNRKRMTAQRTKATAGRHHSRQPSARVRVHRQREVRNGRKTSHVSPRLPETAPAPTPLSDTRRPMGFDGWPSGRDTEDWSPARTYLHVAAMSQRRGGATSRRSTDTKGAGDATKETTQPHFSGWCTAAAKGRRWRSMAVDGRPMPENRERGRTGGTGRDALTAVARTWRRCRAPRKLGQGRGRVDRCAWHTAAGRTSRRDD